METKVGVAEIELNVPLFAELYGYGPFSGRRNWGTRDPLFCRALSFNDGKRRNLLIVSDACVTDDEDARMLRAGIAEELGIEPSGIMIAGTHTHSGPAMSLGIGWGEMHEEYLKHWRETVREAARQALRTEEEITAVGGRAPLTMKLGINRVDSKGSTDPNIRWIKFVRPDGSVKVLLHNHGMHGVVFGPTNRLVSADWMGDVNRRIKEQKLAEVPFYIYGATGDINTGTVGGDEDELERIGSAYVEDLIRGMDAGGETLEIAPVLSSLERTELPTVQSNSKTMRETAKKIYPEHPYLADRLIEMSILAEDGRTFPVVPDLQALQMGDIGVYAFPGEPFYALGKRIMDESPDKFPMAAAVANGNGRYFPTPETFDLFPDIFSSKTGIFGFYEIFQGAGRFMPPYQRNIAEFIVNALLDLKRK
jgi:hypothetical protein